MMIYVTLTNDETITDARKFDLRAGDRRLRLTGRKGLELRGTNKTLRRAMGYPSHTDSFFTLRQFSSHCIL